MPYQIIVVEDSQDLNDTLCEVLCSVGHQVTGFLDAESVIEFVALKNTDIAVLDIELPGESGLILAKRLRSIMPNLGILFLTTRTSNRNRIEGYDSGADYYLPKPITHAEFAEAVDSLIRRKQKHTHADVQDTNFSVLSKNTNRLSRVGESIQLTNSDAAILVSLASAANYQLEYWQLMDLLGSDDEPFIRSSLAVRIFRLRTKLSTFLHIDNPIVAVRGVGYRLGFDLKVQ